MKDSEVYLRAAENVAERDDYSCNAIDKVLAMPGHADYSPQATRYSDLFASRNAKIRPAGTGSLWVTDVQETGNCHEWRVLALCFMAAIAASEGR